MATTTITITDNAEGNGVVVDIAYGPGEEPALYTQATYGQKIAIDIVARTRLEYEIE